MRLVIAAERVAAENDLCQDIGKRLPVNVNIKVERKLLFAYMLVPLLHAGRLVSAFVWPRHEKQ